MMSSLILIVALTLVVGYMPSARACSCFPSTEQESFCLAHSVVLGNVTEAEHLELDPLQEYYIYHVTIMEVFMDHPATEDVTDVLVESPATSGMCGIWLEPGNAYVIESYFYDDVLSTDLCTNTAPWEDMAESVKQGYLTGQYAENCIFYENT